jgi:hypothetical protein
MDCLMDFGNNADPNDDITLLGLEYKGGKTPKTKRP